MNKLPMNAMHAMNKLEKVRFHNTVLVKFQESSLRNFLDVFYSNSG